MSIESQFGPLFKAEVKSSGRKLFSADKVSLSSHSDLRIEAYVRVAPQAKVSLSAETVQSTLIAAECKCPVAQKNRLCKHIWATLLAAEEKCADFLEAKQDIELREAAAATATPNIYARAQETAKQKASQFRKDQYQKHKTREKDRKRERKGLAQAISSSSFSPEVEAAIAYFALNGFPMPEGPSRDILSEAKRTLSRVFHPDKGGSHAESVELNQNCEIILGFFG